MTSIPLPPQKTFLADTQRIQAAPEMIRESQAASWLPEFIGTQVDRSVFAATEGGAGRWAFGTLRTPQRWVLDQVMGWDPDVADKPDPNWNPEEARKIAGSIPDIQRVAVMYAGGQELMDDILNNSVSFEHMRQRLHEVEVTTTARMAIDDYDRRAFLTKPLHNVFSAAVNYIGSDPTTVVSMAATGWLAAAKASSAATGVAQATSTASRINNLMSQYRNTTRAATYLWNGLDGASSAYASWDQLQRDGVRIYGATFERDDNPTDDTLFGMAIGLGFTGAADGIGAWMNKRNNLTGTTGPSTIENVHANSAQGSLNTDADLTSMSLFRHYKSRLEKALDTAEQGPDSSIRRQLMDDDARSDLGWGTVSDMADLADWIEKNRPSSKELYDHVNLKTEAAAQNRKAMSEWTDEVSRYVESGGDERSFYRKKSVDLIRSIMKEDAARYRFLVDWLEEATGDSRLVAEFLARGDKERILRAANAVNSTKNIVAAEAKAFDAAMVRIKDVAQAAEADVAQQAVNRIRDNIEQGRFRGAVDILNEMHDEVNRRHGQLLGEVDATLSVVNREYNAMNRAARRRLGHYEEMRKALIEFRNELNKWHGGFTGSRASMERLMDPNASTSDLLIEAESIGALQPSSARSPQVFNDLRTKLDAARAKFDAADARVRETLASTGADQRLIALRLGKGAIDKTMKMVGDFPSWKADVSEQGFKSARTAAVRQTKAANRWKVEFVDRFLGDNATDNALSSGTNPLRPVKSERAPMRPLTAAEQDKVLAEEMAKAAPDIASIRQGAKDVTIDDKIAIADSQASKLRQTIDQAKAMQARNDNKRIREFIASREKLLKRTENLRKRLQRQLDGQVEKLNEDIARVETVTPETIQAARRDARKALHDKKAKELAEMPVEQLETANGRRLRNKVRRLAAEVEGGTEYNILNREAQSIEVELAPARERVTKLESDGSLDGDPDLILARKKVQYLEKRLNEVRKDISAIENRPIAMKRSHELQGDKPKAIDVADLTRLRADLRRAVDAGDEKLAEEINRNIYAKFGDSTVLPHWKELEDLMVKLDSEADNPTRDVILDIKMDGREAVVTIRRGENLPMSVINYKPPQKPARAFGKERGRYLDELEQKRMEEAVDSTTVIPEPKVEEVRFKAVNPVTEATVAGKPAATNAIGGKVDPKEPSKSDKILAKLTGNGVRGERLLITNGVMNGMGRIPVLRGLGRAIFRLQTAGTGFGEIHNASRSLDLIVSAFNMLDRPEATVKSLGFNAGVQRTLQNFRDQGRIAINQVAAAYQRASNARQWTAASDLNVQRALDAGSAEGLNAGEAEVYELIRNGYRRTGERLNVSRPGTAMENYRAREGNPNAIMRNRQAAQDSFAEVYFERMTSGTPLDNELCDQLGIPRGSTWTSMSDANRAAFESAVRERARFLASQTVNRLSNGIVEEGVGYRIAAQGASSRYARTLEDVVANDPRIRRWYIQSPIEEFKRYMEVRAPEIHFNAQLTEMVGEPCTFEDVLEAVGNQFSRMTDETVKAEAAKVIQTLRSKWEYNVGRAQYTSSDLLDPSIRTSTGLVRGSFGSFWGLAGITTEVPRVVAAAKMYGGTLRGVFDALSYVRRSGDIGLVEDIAHATDQYSSHAHSSFGTSIGTSTWERFTAPWERFFHVAAGREAVTTGGNEMGRTAGIATALAEAYGETGMRFGGMHYFSGMARFVADAQAKRFISRNIDRMVDLSERLRVIGSVSEQTPENIARFRQACTEAGIPYDVAIRMNHAGLLDPDVVSRLRNALTDTQERFDLRDVVNRMDDRSFGSLMDFLTDAHNFHVPTSSLASSVESRSAIDKMFYNLTSYARAFSLNVAFRSAANARLSTMMSTYAAVAIGENIYQSVRDVAMGRSSPEELEREWNEDPTKFFVKRAVKTPWLGAHSSLAMSTLEYGITGSSTSQLRGNNLFGPMVDLLNKTSKAIYADEKTGERDMSVIQTYTPLLNTWYTRLMIGPLEN